VAAQTAIAGGYVGAGAILGQTVASFDGGGITFSGVKSGGADGKGGKLAMVHPWEKITPMDDEKPASTANVTFEIRAIDARDFERVIKDNRGLITREVRKALNNEGANI